MPMSNQKVWWKCPDGEHDDYLRSIDKTNLRDFKCPECSRARNESYLEEKNSYIYKRNTWI